jgi:competence protein ComEC
MDKRRDAFFFLFLGLVSGAWLGFSGFTLKGILAILAGLIFLFVSYKRDKPLALIFLTGFAIGSLTLLFHLVPRNGEGEYAGIVIKTGGNYYIFLSRGVRYYVYEKETEREIGDFLLLKGTSRFYDGTVYESRFDFGDYLRSIGVQSTISAKETVVRWRLPLRLRSYELSYLKKFDSPTRALIDGVLFGHKDYTQNFVQEASSLGCLYFLSASGILYGALFRLSEKLLSLKFDDKKTRLIALVILGLFLPFNVSKVGFWRVYLSKALDLYEKRKVEHPSRIYVSSKAGIIILCFNRFAALDSGFLIGYGLGFFMSLSQSFLARYQGMKGKLVSRSILYLFLFPAVSEGGGIHLLALVYSLVLLPFSLGFGLISFFGFLALPPIRLLMGYGKLLIAIVNFLSKIDIVIPLGFMGDLLIFSYYVLLGLSLYFWDSGLTFMRSVTLLAMALAVGLNAVPFGNALTSEVDFLNVGQGDCILIRDGYTSVMIDTGGNVGFDLAQEVDIPFLRKHRIYELDYLIASHGDFDHIGAAISLRDNFKVRHYVDARDDFPFTVGRLTFTNYNVYNLTSENEQSLVISLDFMGKKWLFTGDAPLSIESRILRDHPEIDCDVLKVGHHGSKTSTSYAWIKTLTPEVAIISVGKRNAYGHPDQEVLDRLASYGVSIRRTDIEGTIIYKCLHGKSLGNIRTSAAVYPIIKE